MSTGPSIKPLGPATPSGRQAGPTIAIVGIDGSGKSTISALLADRLSRGRLVLAVGEETILYRDGQAQARRPISDLPRRALAKHAKSSTSLKRYKIPKLVELLLRDRLITRLERRFSPDVVVLDGSPLINLGAWTRLYKQNLDDDAIAIGLKVMNGRNTEAWEEQAIRGRLPELFTLRNLGLAHMQLPHAVVFLDAPPTTCMERIGRRGGSRQTHETEERLAELREGYIACCSALQSVLGIRVATIQGNLDRDATVEAASVLIEELL